MGSLEPLTDLVFLDGYQIKRVSTKLHISKDELRFYCMFHELTHKQLSCTTPLIYAFNFNNLLCASVYSSNIWPEDPRALKTNFTMFPLLSKRLIKEITPFQEAYNAHVANLLIKRGNFGKQTIRMLEKISKAMLQEKKVRSLCGIFDSVYEKFGQSLLFSHWLAFSTLNHATAINEDLALIALGKKKIDLQIRMKKLVKFLHDFDSKTNLSEPSKSPDAIFLDHEKVAKNPAILLKELNKIAHISMNLDAPEKWPGKNVNKRMFDLIFGLSQDSYSILDPEKTDDALPTFFVELSNSGVSVKFSPRAIKGGYIPEYLLYLSAHALVKRICNRKSLRCILCELGFCRSTKCYSSDMIRNAEKIRKVVESPEIRTYLDSDDIRSVFTSEMRPQGDRPEEEVL